ncbi:UvrD-helicase domain-containing protein [Nocardiopsis halophila]|uniref:UvrD-helicase domain-containing protein n=1 Tax=Nocardiopsis halophila TaxID=141692 RepID=UPI00034D0F7B|nr:UvrD-helicase domain-containing protein [Nocardiopsis halophila]
MPQLALAIDFLGQYAKLEKKVRDAVDSALGKFSDTYFAGGHLERPHEALDPRWRTLRITLGYRGVVLAPDDGDMFLLVAVLPHDDAYQFCKRRRASVNQAFGVLEFRDEANLETVGAALQPVAEGAEKRLFDHVADKHLAQLGIDAHTQRIVRLLPDETHLDALQPMLPAAQHNALVALASGMTVEEAWAELSKDLVEEVEPSDIDPEDLAAAIRRTPQRAVFVEGPEELQDILDHPFDAWRTFLHPHQRRIAYKDGYGGPAMVTGGAGTGKTVTAVHRTAHLAARVHASGQEAGDDTAGPLPILLTTFTKTLDAALRAQIDLLAGDSEERRLVDVRNLDKIAYQVVREETGAVPVLPRTRELVHLWDRFAEGTGFSGRFLLDEWEHVILAQDLTTERDYLKARRRGRGGRLGEGQRKAIWSAVLEATDRMRAEGQWTFTQLASEAAAVLARKGRRLYRHVVVDESQDLHPAKWRLVRALVPEGPDDLFIAGDPHQRIYDHRVSLAAVGINVRGRSRRLNVSYRSTQEILSWAVPLLGTSPVEGLDGLQDRLDGYSSPLHGRRPVVQGFPSQDAELSALADRVTEWMAEGVEADAIGVAARTDALAREAAAALRTRSIATCGLAENSGVRVGTMHSMKGLEFRCTAVVGADAEHLPYEPHLVPADEDPVAHAHDVQKERNLAFVACTRARDSLYVSYTGEPSRFLPR